VVVDVEEVSAAQVVVAIAVASVDASETDFDFDVGLLGLILILIHTEVPEALAGRGIGGRLVRAAVASARAEHLTIVPWCPFARRWLADHHDEAEGVTIDWNTPPNGGSDV
jgi:GNAT superfamily N-acetyltransferase